MATKKSKPGTKAPAPKEPKQPKVKPAMSKKPERKKWSDSLYIAVFRNKQK